MRAYEAIILFEDNLDDIIAALYSNIQSGIEDIHKERCDHCSSWVAEEVHRLTVEDRVGPMIRMHNRAVNFKRSRNNPQSSGITQADILRAKDYPIQDLHGGRMHARGKKLWGCCPLHKERTPSFMVDVKQNRWHCFGACATGGDSIDLYMKLHNVPFVRAVRSLI